MRASKLKLIIAAVVVAALAGGVVAQVGFITLGSGSTAGVYYPITVGIARMINDANIGVRANARSTGGSVFNAGAIQSGELQMTLIQNDVSFYAYNGRVVEAFVGRPQDKLRGIAMLYPEPVHILARRDANIRSVSDFRGKRVYIGDIGSGVEQNALQVLEVYGMTPADLRQAQRGAAGSAAQLLQDGRIDAMFYTVGLGNAAISQASLTTDVVFVEVPSVVIAQLARQYPFLAEFTLPVGAYRGLDRAVTVPTVMASLAASADMTADEVYNVMKVLFDDVARFKSLHSNLETYFTLEGALTGLPIPLHPGAERYWRERGILQ